ncbi:MAG: CotH kinase family protein [Polyangiaceae bacterium]
MSSWLCGAALALVCALALGCSNGESSVKIGGQGGSSPGAGAPNGNGGSASPAGGSANGAGGTTSALNGVVTFSVPSCTFESPFQVTLTSSLPNSEIRYTTSGQTPTASSTLYTGSPLQVSNTTNYAAMVFVNGAPAGLPASVVYVRRSGNISSDLPLIVLDDMGAGPPNQTAFTTTNFMLFETQGGQASTSNPPTVATRAGFHVRGQTSAMFPQQQYRVELRDSTDNDANFPLLGMPSESDWVLHAPYVDKSLLRNAFAYGLGKEMGLQAPRFAFAEVYLNTDNSPLEARDYNGVYLLVETIKNQKDRLNLQQLKATDTALPAIAGGYILKFELDVAEQPILTCQRSSGVTCWQDLEVYDPEPLIASQQAYITSYIQSFHNNLFGSGFADPNTGYASIIDVDSFVNYMVFNELTRNLDAYIRSFYLYKDRDGKLFVGPMWDYNLMAGIGCCGNFAIEGFQYQVARNGEANGWHKRLMTDPVFASRVKNRYHELRAGILSDAALIGRIDGLAAPLQAAAQRHFQKWPILTTTTITFFTTSNANSYAGQLTHMKNWLTQRGAWLDANW